VRVPIHREKSEPFSFTMKIVILNCSMAMDDVRIIWNGRIYYISSIPFRPAFDLLMVGPFEHIPFDPRASE